MMTDENGNGIPLGNLNDFFGTMVSSLNRWEVEQEEICKAVSGVEIVFEDGETRIY